MAVILVAVTVVAVLVEVLEEGSSVSVSKSLVASFYSSSSRSIRSSSSSRS